MWFKKLTGFDEKSPQQVRENISVDGETLTSRVNGATYACGTLETPSLAELRQRVRASGNRTGKISLREVEKTGAKALHRDEANAGALFQVASQFNLLEMPSEHVTPECGIRGYETDNTQGPACAIAAGAGTIYRNYFAQVNGQTGQSAHNQIDCLADLGAAWGNTGNRLWEMKNGYALATSDGLEEISQRLQGASESDLDEWRQLLRIGIQWNTQVTLDNCKHTVAQAYCSALPVGYCRSSDIRWTEFARLILEATYEATVCAAILNAQNTGNNKVFLTSIGGGVFRNNEDWIMSAIDRALTLHRRAPLDVVFVAYSGSKPEIRAIAAKLVS